MTIVESCFKLNRNSKRIPRCLQRGASLVVKDRPTNEFRQISRAALRWMKLLMPNCMF